MFRFHTQTSGVSLTAQQLIVELILEREKNKTGREKGGLHSFFFSHVFSNIAVPRKRLPRQIKGKENIFSPKGGKTK
jgi:hypothetical protein